MRRKGLGIIFVLVFLVVLVGCNKKTNTNTLLDEITSLKETILQLEEETALITNNNNLFKEDISHLEDQLNVLINKNNNLEGESLQLNDLINNLEEQIELLKEISTFNNKTKITNILVQKDDNTTYSKVSYSLPAVEYDELVVSVYYRDELVINLSETDLDNGYFEYNFPHYGKYTLKTKIVIADLEIFSKSDIPITNPTYDFTYLNGTLPVLMYSSNHITNLSNTPTYIHLQRPETIKWDQLPENTYPFPAFIRKDRQPWYKHGFLDVLSQWIYELYELDNDAFFNLNIVDNYPGVPLVLFDRYEIPTDNYNVNIWSDGTFSYSILNSYTNMEILNSRMNHLTQLRKEAKHLTTTDITYNYINEDIRNYAFAYANLMPNVNYYLSSDKGIKITDTNVLAKVDTTYEIMTVESLFDELKASGNLNDFEYLLGTRWGEEANEGMGYYFNSPKGKYLLVLGTSPAGESPNSSNKFYNFNTAFDKTVDMFGEDYEIFYKGHPAFPSDTARKTYFSNNNILELNKSIPVEVLMYIYPNVYIGGFRGSSFLSSMQDQTKFFYGTEAHVKANTQIRDMIDETTIFDNTVYIYDETK